MNTRSWTIAGICTGSLAAALLIVLATCAFTDNNPMTTRFAVGAVVDILLAVAATKLIGTTLVDLAEQRGRELGKAEGFEDGYNQGWVEGAARNPPRDISRVVPLHGIHQRAN